MHPEHVSPRGAPFICGPFPPPLHGASNLNDKIRDLLTQKGVAFTALDIGPGRRRGLAYHFTRLGRSLRAAWRLLFAAGSGSRLLLSVDGGAGITYNLLLAAAARTAGLPLALYHHSTSYLVQTSPRARMLLKLAGPNALHVMCSPGMAAMMQACYEIVPRSLIISNAAWVPPAPQNGAPRKPLQLGHLSGLSEEKGLGRTIDLLRRMRASGTDARLLLAGLPMDSQAENILRAAEREFGAALEWRGLVSGPDKDAFYARLDYFLFPSLYHNETQSLVVPEALAAGVPVIAFDHRFVGEMVEHDGGLVVAVDADYAAVAKTWIENGDLDGRRARARAQFATIHGDGAAQVRKLLDWLTGR